MSAEIRIILDDGKPPVIITTVNGTIIQRDGTSVSIEHAVTRSLVAIKKRGNKNV